MSKVIIEFDPNDPDDAMAMRRAMESTKMAIAIFEIKCNLGKRVKHYVENNINDEDPDAKYQTMDYILEQVFQELEDINIDELIQ